MISVNVSGQGLETAESVPETAETVFASNNKFRQLQQFSRCPSLKVLDLSSNRLRSLDSLEAFSNLTTLNLSHNKITELPSMAPLKSLQTLILKGNRLTEVPPLSCLSKLKTLILSENRLTSFPSFQAPSLRKVALTGNALEAFPFGLAFSQLTELRLHNNKISELPSDVSAMANLVLLDLGRNPLSHGAVLERLCSMRHMENLNIRDTPLMAAEEHVTQYLLENCPRLTSLNNKSVREKPKKRPMKTAKVTQRGKRRKAE